MRTWRERLLRVSSLQPGLISEELIRHVNESSDRASVDAIGYRIVSEYRLQTLERIFGFATSRRDVSSGQELRGLAKRIGIRRSVLISRDDVAEQLLTEQPAHWLPGEYKSWDELLMDAAVGTERELTRRGPLTEARWGVRNRAAIRHPLSQALPFLSRWLDMPEVELPGDNHLPRVQSPAGGASQRMVVSPGEEAKGYYHQPGGQSGHPLSPYYHAGFDDWANGHPSPLLPGPTRHRLVLTANASK
jgi:penicillin amidase